MIAFKFAVWVVHVGHSLAARWQRHVRTQRAFAPLLFCIICRNTQVTSFNEPPHYLSHSLSKQWSLKCHDNVPWRRRQHVSLKRWHLCTNTRYHIQRQLPPLGLTVYYLAVMCCCLPIMHYSLLSAKSVVVHYFKHFGDYSCSALYTQI